MLTWDVTDDQLPSADDLVTRAAAAQYLRGCLPGYGSRFEAIRDQAATRPWSAGCRSISLVESWMSLTPRSGAWRASMCCMTPLDEGPA